MFCNKCGNKIDDDSVFCNMCGSDTGVKNSDETNVSNTEDQGVKLDIQTGNNYADFKQFVDNGVRNNTEFSSAKDILENSKPLKFVWIILLVGAVIGVVLSLVQKMDIVLSLIFTLVVIAWGAFPIAYFIGISKSSKLRKQVHYIDTKVDIDNLINFLNTNLYNIYPSLGSWQRGKNEAIVCKFNKKVCVIIDFSCTDDGKNYFTINTKKEKDLLVWMMSGDFNVTRTNAGFSEYSCLYKISQIVESSIEYYVKNVQKDTDIELVDTPKTNTDTNIAQNTEQQNNNSQSVKQPLETNKNKGKNKTVLICGIVAIIIIAVVLISVGNDKSVTDQTNSEQTNKDAELELSKTFTDEEEGISFNYPQDWQRSKSSINGVDVIVLLKAPEELTIATNMSIGKTDMATDKYTLTDSKSNIAKTFSEYGLEVQEVVDTTIDGIRGRKISSILTDEYNVVQYVYSIDNDVYTVTFTTLIDNFNEYEPIFDSIIDSYTITRTPSSNSQDNGLSKQQALEVAQQFIDTHPLYERTITGDIEYEPEGYPYSTEGLYKIQLIADDGSYRTMWVQKSNGDIFISSDGNVLLTGEEFYDDLSVSFQYNDEILFDGTTIISDYLGKRPKYLYDDFGQPEYGTDVDGSLYEGGSYMGYDGIEFVYDEETSSIEYIFVAPSMCTFNGVSLDKNREELVNLLGTPSSEDIINDDMNETYYYLMTYYMGSYTIQFELENEYSDAYLIGFYYNE